LEKYILEAEKQKALVYLVTPPHRCRFNKGKVTDEMKEYVAAMKSVAKQYDVPVLDLYKRSGDLLNKMGTKACNEYYLSSSDTTHFNKKGSSMMASLVASEAKKDPDIAPFLK
jgi:lysophospholipase L1-like esterase